LDACRSCDRPERPLDGDLTAVIRDALLTVTPGDVVRFDISTGRLLKS
jgi:hypothetical protein